MNETRYKARLSTESLLAEAERLATSGDSAAALTALTRLLQQDRDNLRGLELRADQLLKLGDPEQALTSQSRAVEIAPSRGRLVRRAAIFSVLHQFDAAVGDIDTALQVAGTLPELLLLKGQYLARGERPHEAIEVLHQAAELAPDDSNAWSALGDAHLDDHDMGGALSAYHRAASVSQSPDPHATWNVCGDRLRLENRLDDAVIMYDLGLEAKENVAGWLGRAEVMQLKGDYDLTWKAAARACELDPGGVRQWALQGNALFRLDRLDEALACFDTCARLEPEGGVHWFNVAVSLNALDRSDDALAAIERSIGIAPDDDDAWLLRSELQWSSGLHKEALTSAEAVLTRQPGHGTALFHKARALRALGEPEACLEILEAALRRDTTDLDLWQEKVAVLHDLDRDAEAETDLADLARSSEVDHAFALAIQANFLTDKLGKDDQALAIISRSFELKPSNTLIASSLAECLLKNHRYREARTRALWVADRSASPSIACAMYLIAWASSALLRDEERPADFRRLVTAYRDTFIDRRSTTHWDYSGLSRILQAQEEDDETMFALSTMLDLQTGPAGPNQLSFFEGVGRPVVQTV